MQTASQQLVVSSTPAQAGMHGTVALVEHFDRVTGCATILATARCLLTSERPDGRWQVRHCARQAAPSDSEEQRLVCQVHVELAEPETAGK